MHQHEEFVKAHIEASTSPKVAVMNDGHDIIYFIHLDEELERQKIEVAVYNGDRFVYIPEYLAISLSEKYFSYLEDLEQAKEYIDGREIH